MVAWVADYASSDASDGALVDARDIGYPLARPSSEQRFCEYFHFDFLSARVLNPV
jgi:hypothetical protein